MTLGRRAAAEFIGTAFLLATVVGSGIMGERLAGGNVAIALLANALATGAALIALIATFGPISGAHFNPLVTLSALALKEANGRATAVYLAAQVSGAVLGVIAAHFMFELPLVMASAHVRTGVHQWWSEIVASFGLLTVILHVARNKPDMVPATVGAYITAAYWFTASTSFANPAVTIARALTDTFSGIRPGDAPGFIVAQLIGAALAVIVFRWFYAVAPVPTPTQPQPEIPRHV
jgi:glycerol uptake facilitator-like aquaporin